MTSNNTNAYDLEVRFGSPLLELGFTALPNIFLRYYTSLGIEDAAAMFLTHLIRYKWTAENPYPRRNRLPMSCNEDTRRRYTRQLRKRGLLFTRRRYFTAETAPTPADAGKQASMEYDFETLFHNLVWVHKWLDQGHDLSDFRMQIPFGVVYRVVTKYYHDVPRPIHEQCVQHLQVSADAVTALTTLVHLVPRETWAPTARLITKTRIREDRARIAVEHLLEAHLIAQQGEQVRLLTADELTDRPALIVDTATVRNSHGSSTVRNPHSSATVRNSHGGDTVRKHTGIKYTGMFSPPLKEESVLKEETDEEEELMGSSSSSPTLHSLLCDFNIQEPARSEFVRAKVNPAAAQAWMWKTALSNMDPERWAGYVIVRLRQGDTPPEELLTLAQAWLGLDDDAQARLWRAAHRQHVYGQQASVDDFPIAAELWSVYYELHQAEVLPRPSMAVGEDAPEEVDIVDATAEAKGASQEDQPAALPLPADAIPRDDLWRTASAELSLQVRPDDQQWIQGTRLGVRNDAWVVVATTTYARDWLDNRLAGLIRKTLTRLTGEERGLVVLAAKDIGPAGDDAVEGQ